MDEIKRPLRAGAKLLREYIREHFPSDDGEGNVSAFCREHELDRVHILRVLSGERFRINVDLIRDIHRATKGGVPWWSWTTDGEAPDVQRAPVAHTASDFAPVRDSSVGAGV